MLRFSLRCITAFSASIRYFCALDSPLGLISFDPISAKSTRSRCLKRSTSSRTSEAAGFPRKKMISRGLQRRPILFRRPSTSGAARTNFITSQIDRITGQKVSGSSRWRTGKESSGGVPVTPTRLPRTGPQTPSDSPRKTRREGFFTAKQLAISKRDVMGLGIAQGPEVGRIPQKALETVVDKRVENERDTLLGFVRYRCLHGVS